jgi:3-phosphoshikimate 1-carboxyvinyltransferase
MTGTHRVEPLAGPPDAEVAVPGSKSITNRALVAALLAEGQSTLTNVLVADDTVAMVEAVRALGAVVAIDGDRAEVVGTAGRLRPGPLAIDARQAGTVARFLPPVLALGTGPYRLDAAPSMRARPMAPLVQALRDLGVRVDEEGSPGSLPFVVHGGGLRGGVVVLPGDVSSQFVSGLLLAAPLTPRGLRVELATPPVSRPYLDMTLAVMRTFGALGSWDGERALAVPAGTYRSAVLGIEPDATAASYFFGAAAAFGGRVRVAGLGRGSLQGDLRFVEILAAMGAEVDVGDDAVEVRGVRPLRGVEVDMRDLSDCAQTLAAVAVFATSPTRVTGIGFIRRKETDRVGAMVGELRRVGIDAREEPDGFVVHPGRPRPARVETHGDHRMAMSLALVALGTPGGLEIVDPGCVAKTFPGFWDALDALHVTARGPAAGRRPRVIAIDGPAGSGKSTVAREVARRLGLDWLDTGAMYRCVALAAIRRGIDPGDAEALARVAAAVDIDVGERVHLDGTDVTADIRSPEVTRVVSAVAAVPAVRAEMVRRQRAWAAARGGGVVEGRDIGSVVFPDAELKVFLTATDEERARRRAAELGGADTAEVAADMARRDRLDATRATAPLTVPDGAVVIDTTGRTVSDVVGAILGMLEG